MKDNQIKRAIKIEALNKIIVNCLFIYFHFTETTKEDELEFISETYSDGSSY